MQMCHWEGNRRWPVLLDSRFRPELSAEDYKEWKVRVSTRSASRAQVEKKSAGQFIKGGDGAGNFTFLRIYNAVRIMASTD